MFTHKATFRLRTDHPNPEFQERAVGTEGLTTDELHRRAGHYGFFAWSRYEEGYYRRGVRGALVSNDSGNKIADSPLLQSQTLSMFCVAELMAKSKTGERRIESPQVEALARSQLFVDYQRAFTKGTGLPLALHGPEMMRLVHYPKGQVNPFCALMAKTGAGCTACYSLQLELEQKAGPEMKTLKCFAGLCESAVPVRLAKNAIAFLHTGQVLLHPLSRSQFKRVARRLLEWGVKLDLRSVEEAYFQTRVLRPAQYKSLVRLLTIFANHLGACSNELLLQPKAKEPITVIKARQFISNHHTEQIPLTRLADTVNTSATYFSKRFKQVTGMTFVDYLGRVRVEKAKSLLQNPSFRISDIALDAGFQSLSQFNRTFKKVTGRAPKTFRNAIR